ncbi:DinB family protein [Grimontia indica]|uniref:DinB family protein n=1 Tax=Grimontia indica TaxID=1056512 RepID=R1IJY5_9GAMM|nr:DinB family protein [Grimontia indica]EOD77792.1 DinB family protein [Grimontia indica]
MKSQFELMAKYNRWMNEQLLGHLENLSDEDLYEDRRAFFGSAFHTMSHILTGDLLWLNRFTRVPSEVTLEQLLSRYPAPPSNTVHLVEDLASLKAMRASLDDDISRWVASIPESEFNNSLTYRNTAGAEYSENLASVLLHFFNHQTHHRGQLTTLLSQSGDNDYFTDLIAVIRQ